MSEPRKPCPFCGGKAVYYPRHSGQDVSSLTVYHEHGCYLLRLLRMCQQVGFNDLSHKLDCFHHDAWERRVDS